MMSRARKLGISSKELWAEGMRREQAIDKDDFLQRLKQAVAELKENATRQAVAKKIGYKNPHSFVKQARKLGISRQDLEAAGVILKILSA